METIDDNKIIYEGAGEECLFKYNFINTPWDDRSKNSKLGIVSLLLAIAAVIITCVINSFVMHYRGHSAGQYSISNEHNCHLVKKDDYLFVARIYSVSTKELLCVGAVIGSFSVLANDVCVKSGPILLHIGSLAEPRCKKGFSVDAERTSELQHEGVVAKKLIVIHTQESIEACSIIINVGLMLDWNSPTYVIGRPLLRNSRSLTKQPVALSGKGNCSLVGMLNQKLDKSMILCVKDVGRCPVRVGDLLVQHNRLFGIASTSAHRSDLYNTAYFADLSIIYAKIKLLLELEQ